MSDLIQYGLQRIATATSLKAAQEIANLLLFSLKTDTTVKFTIRLNNVQEKIKVILELRKLTQMEQTAEPISVWQATFICSLIQKWHKMWLDSAPIVYSPTVKVPGRICFGEHRFPQDTHQGRLCRY